MPILWRQKSYRSQILATLCGTEHGITVCFRDYPIRVSDAPPQTRIEYFPDFNVALLSAIWVALGDFEDFARRALAAPVALSLTIANAPPFSCSIGRPVKLPISPPPSLRCARRTSAARFALHGTIIACGEPLRHRSIGSPDLAPGHFQMARSIRRERGAKVQDGPPTLREIFSEALRRHDPG